MNPRKLKHLGDGRNRSVYLLPSGLYVVKFPKNNWGVHENYVESRSCKRDDYLYRWQKAKCRLAGLWLIMEYVSQVPYDELPDWSKYVDGGQVGLNRKGEYVAYDYA